MSKHWYQEGLRFECTECGNCCSGPSGTVWFDLDEARDMAAALSITIEAFYEQHAECINGRWTLREQKTADGFDCVFLDRDSKPGSALCRVYRQRPAQCRTWPFWGTNLRSRSSWEFARKETPCPGMDQGKVYFVPFPPPDDGP